MNFPFGILGIGVLYRMKRVLESLGSERVKAVESAK
jgi:hypothetical protein